MADLSETSIYFAIGVPFENAWLKKIAAANPRIKVVHTDHGIEKRPMAREIGGQVAFADPDNAIPLMRISFNRCSSMTA
jgi:hypothetical protein